MANQEQLEILKRGVDAWNDWLKNNDALYPRGDEDIDLSEADLSGHFLENVNFFRANLHGANLESANLAGANIYRAGLIKANLELADLTGAKIESTHADEVVLIGANLSKVKIYDVNMTGANLRDAILVGANIRSVLLEKANFNNADLSQSLFSGHVTDSTSFNNTKFQGAQISASFDGADLRKANFVSAILDSASFSNTNLSFANFGFTTFINSNLSNANGLEIASHIGNSTVGTNTLLASKGKIPEIFLQGCGLSDWEIEAAKLYNPELTNEERNKILYKIYDLQASQAIQISPLFISYSHANSDFVDRIEKSLNEKGVRFWRDTHDMKAGRLEKQIDHAIRQNPTVLLVLSEHSLESDWVELEVRTARELEKETGRDVLCPVSLDDSWKSSRWPKRLMAQIKEYNILDFSEWDDNKKFNSMFKKLIDGLDLFYKKEGKS